MTNPAPERIWAAPASGDLGTYAKSGPVDYWITEYVRADLAPAPDQILADIDSALFEAHALLTFHYQSYMKPPSETDGRYEESMLVWNLEPKAREMMGIAEIDLFDALMKLKPGTHSPDRRVSVAEANALRKVYELAAELCTAIDCEVEDIGGQRKSIDILEELGPATDVVRALAKEDG